MSDENPNGLSGEPAAELLKRLSEQTSRLISQELALAKVELTEKGKRAGLGAGMFGAAGVAALYGVGALIATVIAVLATTLDTWLAALIVTAVLFVVAGVLALVGKSQVSKAVPPVPEQTLESVKADVQTTKDSAQRGRA